MRILVAVPGYTTPNLKQKAFFFQARNINYKDKGIDVVVLNFRCNYDYEMDGMKVICLNTYKKNPEEFDLLICHQPNIKWHYSFLKKYKRNFKKVIYFFHGHEVLKLSKVYSKPYTYNKAVKWYKRLARDIYDDFKLLTWRKFFKKNYLDSYFVFVSNWMKREFLKWVKLDEKYLDNRHSIIYNCVGKAFEQNDYDVKKKKEYDFITIRANLDGSKYCIDVVNKLAWNNPDLKFCVVGKGEFFDHYEKAPNLEWKDMTMTHNEMLSILDSSKCALMPTRTDAQGLMMCEMATYGIPVITSNLDVCQEALGDFDNVDFIDLENLDKANLEDKLKKLSGIKSYKKYTNYFSKNTSDKEIEVFEMCLKGIDKK